tara:strand:- start:109 stop:636 length:528 start_codon:yes stop_codon:yes gene_type:complete
MKVKNTPLEGFKIIELDAYSDDRGFFLESYHEDRYREHGIEDIFLQENHSRSKKNVLRGMHYQIKNPQAQIVTIIRGSILDVVVDIRPNSVTYGNWHSVELSDNGFRQVYMAPGFAHGFLVLSDWVDMHYKVTTLYNPSDEGGLIWNDPEVAIKWPMSNPIMSLKDKKLSFFKDL